MINKKLRDYEQNIFFLLASLLFLLEVKSQERIPIKDALNTSNVIQNSLSDYNKNGIFLGNGDLFCVVSSSKNNIRAALFKSDV